MISMNRFKTKLSGLKSIIKTFGKVLFVDFMLTFLILFGFLLIFFPLYDAYIIAMCATDVFIFRWALWAITGF